MAFVKETPGGKRYRMTEGKAKHYGARGGKKANTRAFIYIGDEILTYEDIAQKLGVCKSTAEKRVLKLRRSGTDITWEALGYGQE